MPASPVDLLAKFARTRHARGALTHLRRAFGCARCCGSAAAAEASLDAALRRIDDFAIARQEHGDFRQIGDAILRSLHATHLPGAFRRLAEAEASGSGDALRRQCFGDLGRAADELERAIAEARSVANASLQEAAQDDSPDEPADDGLPHLVALGGEHAPVMRAIHHRLTGDDGDFLREAFDLVQRLATARQLARDRPFDKRGAAMVTLTLRDLRHEIDALPWPKAESRPCDCIARSRSAIAELADLRDSERLIDALFDLRKSLKRWMRHDGAAVDRMVADAVVEVLVAALEAGKEAGR